MGDHGIHAMHMNLNHPIWIYPALLVCFRLVAIRCQTEPRDYAILRADILGRSASVQKVPPNISPLLSKNKDLHIEIQVLDILSIDQVEQLLSSIILVNINWTIADLQWNPDNYSGLNIITIDSSSIWTPQLVVSIGAKDSLYLTMPDIVTVTSSGIIWSTNHHYLSFRCHVDFTRYPFDVQSCGFGLYPLNHPFPSMEMVDKVFNNSGLYDLVGEWQLVSHKSEMVYLDQFKPHPRVTFTVKRKPVYYVIVLIFPMVLTSLLTPLVFLIPPETGEKMSYLVAILTSTAIFITLVSDAMPRSLSSLPYLAMLLIEVMVEGLCAILASLLVVNTYVQEQNVISENISHKSSFCGGKKTETPSSDTPFCDTPPPDSASFDTSSSDTPSSDTYFSVTPFCDTQPPDSASSDTSSSDTPSSDTYFSDKPSSDTPPSDTPSSDTPSSDIYFSDTPSSDTPPTDTPSSDTPSSDTPSSDTPFCDTPPPTQLLLTHLPLTLIL
ncbi:hypothetical protein Btru_038682 [Bulinus truncatus]|nr:hypothetical protein Btru_038682 [Bulinus truncatus]